MQHLRFFCVQEGKDSLQWQVPPVHRSPYQMGEFAILIKYNRSERVLFSIRMSPELFRAHLDLLVERAGHKLYITRFPGANGGSDAAGGKCILHAYFLPMSNKYKSCGILKG